MLQLQDTGMVFELRQPGFKVTFLFIILHARTFLSTRDKTVNKTGKIPAFKELMTSERDYTQTFT